MGFRMSIKVEGEDEEYGDDHKFYGYAKYEQVKNSFSVLVPLIKEQWVIDDMSNIDPDIPEEIYEIFIWSGSTDELVLDNYIYTKFMIAYLSDLRNYWKNPEDVRYIEQYMEPLSKRPENKILWWC